MATPRHRKDSVRNKFLQVLDESETQEFIRQFAPPTPRRAEEFKRLLANLIERCCIAREDAAVDNTAVLTAKALGQRGGLKGGKGRARSLSPAQRAELAKRAAVSRWHGENNPRTEAVNFIVQFQKSKGRTPSCRAVVNHFKVSTSTARRWLRAANQELHGPRVDAL